MLPPAALGPLRTPPAAPRAPPPSLLRSLPQLPPSLPRAPASLCYTSPPDPPATSPQPPHPCTCSSLPQALPLGPPCRPPAWEVGGEAGAGPTERGAQTWRPRVAAPRGRGLRLEAGRRHVSQGHFGMAKPPRELPLPEPLQTPLQQAHWAWSETY